MQLEAIEMREIRLPLVHFFETSFGRTLERRILLVRVRDTTGVVGWGECTAGEGPFYCAEWTESAWAVIATFLAPLLVGQELSGPGAAAALLGRVRGNRMAKAALETACWDVAAQRAGLPLWQLLGGTQREIPCGVSIGIQDTPAALLDKIARELAAGYQRIKIKIKPGWDVAIVARVRARYPDIKLMVDANSAYTLADGPLLQALDRFNLMMIEQPLAHDDMFDHATLQQQLATPICLDESIHSSADARKALALGAARIVNIKLGRVGGHAEAQAVEQVCRAQGVPVWCGGMLESGIGRAHNIAMATLPGFTLPGDVSASARYWTEDVIEPPVTVSARGTILAPDAPGLGYAINEARIEALTVRRAHFKAA